MPLYVLAAGAVVVGWFGIPNFLLGKENRFERFLEPVILPLAGRLDAEAHEMSHATEWGLMVASIAIAVLGIFLAVVLLLRLVPVRDAGEGSRPPSAASTGSCATSTASTSSTRPSS